ncbi:MAG: hypothetical protein K8F60_08930 [Melioribacteraceae bacterium]|jgi:hypothetical protein|nr:hypothetical protein [Melioribacteraceae bacterium]
MKFTASLSLLIIIAISLFSCKEEPTKPPTEANLSIEVLDKSCTEVWIDVKANDQTNKLGSVYLNDEFRTQFYLKDTLVYLDELLPNKTYTIKLINQDGIGTQTEFTTMDTTSHNFTWETFEFGGVNGSSYLRDVAIINENNIWAVGEIYTKDTYTYDSNGVFQQPYNAVHWDGNKWELKRIIVNFRGNPTFIPLEGIYAFASNDIWMVGSLPIHGNGTNWEIHDVREITNSSLSLSKAWGTSSEDMYFVGRAGSIAHYNGSSWSKIESGTESTINKIYGIRTNEGNYKIFCTVTSHLKLSDHELLQIEGSQVKERISPPNSNIELQSVWGKGNGFFYTCGSGVYKRNYNGEWRKENELPYIYTYDIKGTDYNNIFLVGSFGMSYHYNGVRWQEITPPDESVAWNLRRISIGENTVVFCGYTDKAILYVGKK